VKYELVIIHAKYGLVVVHAKYELVGHVKNVLVVVHDGKTIHDGAIGMKETLSSIALRA